MIKEFDHGKARKVKGSSREKPITGTRKMWPDQQGLSG